MLRFRTSRPVERSRRKAARALFIRHGMERTPEGRSLRLLRQWLSSSQRSKFAEESCFEVVGGDTGKRYRIHAGAATNVCELDERGRPTLGLPMGDLPIGTSCCPRRSRWKAPRATLSERLEDSPQMAHSDAVGSFAELN
jgi:hypothetical protein